MAQTPEETVSPRVRGVEANWKSIVHAESQSDPQPTLYPVELQDLNSAKYQLKICPIQILVEAWPDNEYIAHWHLVEAIGFGETKEEAIDALRECIIELYERLSNTEDKKLGKIPLQAKKILQQTLGINQK